MYGSQGGYLPPELAAMSPSIIRPGVPPGVPGQMPYAGLPMQPPIFKPGLPPGFPQAGLPSQFPPGAAQPPQYFPPYNPVPVSPGVPVNIPKVPVQPPMMNPGNATPPVAMTSQVPSFIQPAQPKPGVRPPGQTPGMPGSDIQKVQGTPLPPIRLNPGELALDRFPTVLPPMGNASAERSGNQRGWFQTQGRNQVEAMNFVATENLLLVGVSLAAPLNPQQNCRVDFVNLYRGKDTRGQPTYSHRGGEIITGGNKILSDIRFSQSFQVLAGQMYSMKVKFSGDPPGSYETYRGNPFDRPDVWFSEDGILWEFEECNLVEPSEYLNGQNNLSGPILRLIYRR